MLSKVCVILVNYNNHNDTIECLESVIKNTYTNYQVVVVDNSTTNDSFNYFREWSLGRVATIETRFRELVYPLTPPHEHIFVNEEELQAFSASSVGEDQILFVKINKNFGFAHANNKAIAYALNQYKADFVWLLNNDTVIDKEALTNLVLYANASVAKTGMWGSKLLLYMAPETIQGVGGKYNKWTGVARELGYRQKDDGQCRSASGRSQDLASPRPVAE